MGAGSLDKFAAADSEIGFYPSTREADLNPKFQFNEFEDGDNALDTGPDNRRWKSQPRVPVAEQFKLDPTAIFTPVANGKTTKLAPEQSITLFALRLAILEKVASGIGTLAFIWASTIILGGFASNIDTLDFIVVTMILTTEGARIFSRGRELEWQHLASKSTSPSGSLTALYEELATPSKLSLADFSRSDLVKVKVKSTVIPEAGQRPMASFQSERGLSELEAGTKPKKKVNFSIIHSEKDVSHHSRFKNGASKPARYLRQSIGNLNVDYKDTSHDSDHEGSEEAVSSRKKGPRNSVEVTKRTWNSDFVPVLPDGMNKIMSNRGVSAILSWVQFSSAIICLGLSGWRISRQDFDPPNTTKDDRPVNLYMCINLFYLLVLLEAFLYLVERMYWEYTMSYEHLILGVSEKAGLGAIGQEIMKQFFYEVYKKCIEGSVFDGLEMDLVEFSLNLLQSESTFEQLGGLCVLRRVVDRHDHFSADALRRIGTTPGVLERLVEMLSWQSSHHRDILRESAALVCRSVRYSKNCIRIASVAGSMDAVVSLVKASDRDHSSTSAIDKSMMDTLPTTVHNISGLRLDGLRILVAQARDPTNLQKIGEARGLVPALVSFLAIQDKEQFTNLQGAELKTFKKVLRLLGMLAAARNVAGTVLRPIVARVVSCMASMRDILQFGDSHPQLQWMAIEVLTNLALDDEIRVVIGGTGGIIRNLLMLYIRDSGASGEFCSISKVKLAVSKRAGEALHFLAIQNRKNCLRMMELEVDGKRVFLPALIALLSHQKENTICAAKILRTLMEYASDPQQREIAECAPKLLRMLITSTNKKLLEAVIGLTAGVVSFLNDADYNRVVETVDRVPLIRKLFRNLDHDPQTFSSFPRIRRYTVECILSLVKRDPIFLDEFTRDGWLERRLVQTLDSICEVENFLTFSGSEGLTRHSTSVEDLIQETILELRVMSAKREQSKNQFYFNHAQ